MICNDSGENQSDGRNPDSHVVLKDQEGPEATVVPHQSRIKTISHKKERCCADIQDNNTPFLVMLPKSYMHAWFYNLL